MLYKVVFLATHEYQSTGLPPVSSRLCVAVNGMRELRSHNPRDVRIFPSLDIAQSNLFLSRTRNWSLSVLKKFACVSFPTFKKSSFFVTDDWLPRMGRATVTPLSPLTVRSFIISKVSESTTQTCLNKMWNYRLVPLTSPGSRAGLMKRVKLCHRSLFLSFPWLCLLWKLSFQRDCLLFLYLPLLCFKSSR